MTFLKKFGMIVGTIAKIVTGLGPLIPSSSERQDKVQNTILDIAGIILVVESLGASLQIPGNDKLKAAGPLVAQIILQSDLMIGKKIDNPTLFAEGASSIADGMAKILNSVKADSLQTKDIPQ